MKKLLLILLLFLFPLNIWAKEDSVYTIYVSNYFLDQIHNNVDIDNYLENCHLSIRDYLLFKELLTSNDIKEDSMISVSNEVTYSLEDDIKILLLKNFKYIQIKVDDDIHEDNYFLNFTSLDSLLDSSMYYFSLFYDSLKNDTSELEFHNSSQKNIYGEISSKNTYRTLLEMRVLNQYLFFHIPDNISVEDNTSFVLMNSSSNVDYVSLIFSNRLEKKKNMSSFVVSPSLLIPVVLLFFVLFFISVFFVKRKK